MGSLGGGGLGPSLSPPQPQQQAHPFASVLQPQAHVQPQPQPQQEVKARAAHYCRWWWASSLNAKFNRVLLPPLLFWWDCPDEQPVVCTIHGPAAYGCRRTGYWSVKSTDDATSRTAATAAATLGSLVLQGSTGRWRVLIFSSSTEDQFIYIGICQLHHKSILSMV